eukprot:SAG22_NODE_7767_length_710_cov_0.882160_1_plen_193_part_10
MAHKSLLVPPGSPLAKGGGGGVSWLANRWLCLAGGCGMIVCAGSILGFGSFAEDLKRNLKGEFTVGREAQQEAQIALCGNLGLWIGSFSGGILADAKGPRLTLVGGACLFFAGYGGMHLAFARAVLPLRQPEVVALLWLMAGVGSGWVYNATVFTNTQNWGAAGRAKVVGLLATLFGAASTIWSTVFNGCVGG